MLNEIANPKSAQICKYDAPLCFDLIADAPIRSKESIEGFITIASSSLSKDIGAYFMDDGFSDVTVRHGSFEFPAHRIILASRSGAYESCIINTPNTH